MKSQHFSKLVALVAGALAAIALAAPVASAQTPAEGYEQFRGCPTVEQNEKTIACVASEISGGHFQMGNKDVPITNPITITGGAEAGLKGFAFNSEGGMSESPQKVPGGVIGLTGLTWLLEFLGSEALTLYAVTEAVGLPTLGFTALSLPIRVHMVNPILGNSCYIGSPANPITLNLITGTTSPPPPNEPIKGEGPFLSNDFETGIATVEGIYVDNSFSAPGANGCKLVLFGFIPIGIDGLVNAASELPAAAGTNETIQEITTEIAPRTKVYP
ncbi:MAG: hypothetical protein R2725_03290 [Solirubrobacterales bacterium]